MPRPMRSQPGSFPTPLPPPGGARAGPKRSDNMIPAGRTGSIYEFGWLSAMTCTDLLGGLTGQVILQDGGENCCAAR